MGVGRKGLGKATRKECSAMGKVTYDDLFELVREMERGAKDRSRTLGNISNSTVRSMLQSESKMAINAGVTKVILAGGTGATGAVIGSVGGAGTGIVSTGLVSLGITSLTAAGGAAAGGAAGSVIPVVGTVIGAAVGVGVGLFVGNRISKKNAEKKRRLMQEVMSKQNTIIRDLEKELEELKQKYGESVAQNERYKYIIGILMANEELKKCA